MSVACQNCGDPIEGRKSGAKFCSDNCRKRAFDSGPGRKVCVDCGGLMGPNTKHREYLRCRPCAREYDLRHSVMAQVLQDFNAGKTHHEIAAELGISPTYVGAVLHRIRYSEWGKPYVERYGFPEYRRTPEQVARIRAGSRRGHGLAA